MDQMLTTTGLNDLATTWASTLGSSSLATSSFTTSSLETSSLTTSASTASPFANCTDLVDPPVCNITACNFGHGCIIDFSTMDMDPWRVMEPWRLALFGVGLALTTVPGVIGNVLVISIILSNKIMQSEINMFILNMAVADLIASLVLPPTFLVTNVFQAYMLGPWWCKYGGTVRLTLLLTSVFSISVISVDRLWGLMRPFHRQIPPLAIKAIMLSTWVVAAAIGFYPAQFNKYSKRQYRDFLDIMCEQTNISRMRTYWWVVCVFLIWIPAIILFTCFVIIFIKMRRLKASNKKSGHHRFVSPATRARQRAVRLVFAMFVTFFICWTPFLVYVLQYQLATTTHDNGKPWEELYYASHFMMHLVPVINPVLYALLHENFRRAATVTCPWLPSKVKYQAFPTGDGGRVRWSQRGPSLASSPSIVTLARVSDAPACPQLTSATSADSLRSAEIGQPPLEGGEVEGCAGSTGRGSQPPEVSLIWGALKDRHHRPLCPTSLSPLPGIAEESESRKSSIRSSIDLQEAEGLWMTSASGQCNSSYSPD